MSITSYYATKINIQGDVTYGQDLPGVSNTTSEFENKLVDVTTTGVQILTGAPNNGAIVFIPPAGNTNTVELRADTNATTGITLSTTQPTIVALHTTMTQVALFASSTDVSGVRVILL